MKINSSALLWALTAFMVTWQATDFALDYRAILSAIVTGVLGGGNPKKTK